MLGDKDETIRQLELKLLTASNQRERAEQRCGQTLEENERIRSDLMTLASQVDRTPGTLVCLGCLTTSLRHP